jgi:hypothetical protein
MIRLGNENWNDCFKMRIKNFREMRKLFDKNFTGILEYCDGEEFADRISFNYYKNANHHRENGPALVFVNNGDKYWCLNGNWHLEEKWKIEVEKLNRNKLIAK